MNLRRLLLFCFFALSGIGAASSPAMPVAFNIKTYVSPSGRFEFEVDPTEFSGKGPGDCILKKKGRMVWKARLPFTFHAAQVADDGTVAGYGYAVGNKDESALRFAIIGPDGKLRLDKRFARADEGYYGEEVISVRGMCMEGDRFAVFMGSSGLCRSFRISNGKPLGVTTPPMPVVAGEGNVSCSLQAAVQISGTPLTLLHWRVEDYQQTSSDNGAVFTLIDSTGAQVWELIALRDYANPDKAVEKRIERELWESGAVSNAGKAGTFEIWLAKKGQKVGYAVQRADRHWKVAEVSREEHELAPLERKKAITTDAPALEKLGSLTLEAPPLNGPVTDVTAFGFDGRGRIGFLRGCRNFVIVEQNGSLSLDMPLQVLQDPPVIDPFGEPVAAEPKLSQGLPGDAEVLLTWISADRWLVTASKYDSQARAWWIDAGKKTMTEIEEFECLRIDSLAGAGDGGFVVLTSTPNNYTSDLLVAFDAAGKKRWSITANQNFTPESFFSPDSVAVTSRGEIAVLDQARQTVHLYDLNGNHRRTVELKKEWKSENPAARDITADADGGFIVSKLGEERFVRMAAEGKVRGEFATKFKDEGVPYKYGEIRIDPTGRMWQNNRHNLVRLDDNGVVDEIAGTKADEDKLGVIAVATSDAKGLIYLADDQTGAVHVFSSEGRKLHVCKPAEADTPGNLRSPNLTVTDEGRVFLRGDWCDERFMVFGADGARETPVPSNRTFQWDARRGNGGMLMNNYHELLLTDKAFAVKRTIERWPDRRWFDYCRTAAVAGDGSFVVLGGSGPEQGLIGFYSPEGEPQRMARLLEGWDGEELTLAGWNGKHLVLSEGSSSFICDRDGKPVRQMSVPVEKEKWAQFLMRDGRELWILEFENRKITRYAMPSGG